MKVSIITVVYNNVDTIKEAIESVINQTYHDIEYILIDGKSNDGTLEIIESYGDKISKVVSEEDSGIYDAMNKGLSLSSGDIIGFINADDKIDNNEIIKNVVNHFIDDVDIVYGDLIFVDRLDSTKICRHWKAGKFKKIKYKFGWMTPHPSTYIKKEIYEKYGSFDLRFKIAADYELMLRFMYKNNLRVKYLPEVIVRMRDGGISNNSLFNIFTANYEVFKSWKVNNLSVSPLIILIKPLLKLKQFLTIK